MTADSIIRARLPKELHARLVRIGVVKQASSRASSSCLREAVVEKVEREERELGLKPITKKEVRELLKEAA